MEIFVCTDDFVVNYGMTDDGVFIILLHMRLMWETFFRTGSICKMQLSLINMIQPFLMLQILLIFIKNEFDFFDVPDQFGIISSDSFLIRFGINIWTDNFFSCDGKKGGSVLNVVMFGICLI